MGDTNFNIGLQLTGLGNTVGGLQQTTQAINQVTAASQAMQNRFGGVGGAAAGALGIPLTAAAFVAGLVGSVRELVREAGNLKDVSEQLGILPSEFADIKRTAADAGLPVSNFVQTLSALRQARRGAAEGNQELRDTFAQFGVTLRDLNDPGQRAIDLLQKIGRAAAGLNEADLSRLRDILGPRADRVAGALAGFGTAVDKEMDQAIAGVDRLDKAFEKLGRWAKDRGIVMLGGLANVLTGARDFWQGTAQNAPRQEQADTADFEIYKHNERKRAEMLRNVAAGYDRGASQARDEELAARQAGNGAAELAARQAAEEIERAAALAREEAEQALRNAGMGIGDWRSLPEADRRSAMNREASRGGGPSLYEDVALEREMAALAERRQRFAFEGMTTEQKRAELLRQQAVIEKALAEETDARGRVAKENQLLDVREQLRALPVDRVPKMQDMPTNAWERMGLTSGFGSVSDRTQKALDVAQETARHSQNMAQQLEAMRLKLENGTLFVSFPL